MSTNTADTAAAPTRILPRVPLVLCLWLVLVVLFYLHLITGSDLTLLPYFPIPALIAAAFARPQQVFWLGAGALALGAVSGWYFDRLLTTPYVVRLGALCMIVGVGVLFAVARERFTELLSKERALLRATLDTLIDPHVLLEAVRDDRGNVIDFVFADANEAACRYNRLARSEYVGHRLLELFPALRDTELFEMYCRVIESGRPLALDDFRFSHETPTEARYYDIRAVKVGDALSYTWREVTDRHAAAALLKDRASTDELTKLLNRREVLERLDALRKLTPRSGSQLAVLFVDFDGFKAINDTYGHAVGDEILKVTADRLRSCLRHGDFGARIGGDELIVILPGVRHEQDAMAIAEKLHALAAQPIHVNGTEITATVSIGVALADAAEPTETLLLRADQAMYAAKQAGRNRIVALPAAR